MSEQINYFCTAFPRIGWVWWLTWFSSAETDLHLPCWRRSSAVSVARYKHCQGAAGYSVLHCPEGQQPANKVLFLSERAAREAKEHFHAASSVFTEPNESMTKNKPEKQRTVESQDLKLFSLACWDIRVQAEWDVIVVCCNTCMLLYGRLPWLMPSYIHNVCCTISGSHFKKI